MTAAERLGAALMTAALSQRVSELYALDRSEDAVHVPAQRPSTP